jgi:outer membrane protein assembly factor BamB
LATFAAAFACCVLTSSPARADEWPTYQHDVHHTGRSAAAFDPRDLRPAWTSPAGYANPVVAGDTVYALRSAFGVGVPSHYAAFDLADGRLKWSFSGDFLFPSAPAVGEGLLVFAATNRSANENRLYVHDAGTGAFKYSVPIEPGSASVPTIYREPGGAASAYVTTDFRLSAVSLGDAGGSLRWSGNGSFSAPGVPTIAGESIVVAGPGQFYAFRRTDGAENHFVRSSASGGGGTTPAFDADRSRLYVLSNRDSRPGQSGDNALSAFDYVDNGTITERWMKTAPGLHWTASVAIGPDGKLYAYDNNALAEIDPDTGAVLRSRLNTDLALGFTPLLHDGYLWATTNSSVVAYDLATLTRVLSLPGAFGTRPLAIADGYLLVDRGGGNDGGFAVYRVVPEPAGAGAAGLFLLARRRRR